MNKSNNQRYRETEERIIQSFTDLIRSKPLEEVTVHEICASCGINRSSFYLHFKDIYDLLDKMERELARQTTMLFIDKPGQTISESFMRFFEFVFERREFYRVYFKNANRSSHLVSERLPDDMKGRPWEIGKLLGFATEQEYQYHTAFFKAGLTAMIREWVDKGCPESPAEMVAILEREYSHEKHRLS
jgi:AcrR family transcriptional regulator